MVYPERSAHKEGAMAYGCSADGWRDWSSHAQQYSQAISRPNGWWQQQQVLTHQVDEGAVVIVQSLVGGWPSHHGGIAILVQLCVDRGWPAS